MKFVLAFCVPVWLCLTACAKDVGKNPALAYSDRALLDSCRAAYHRYYKNDSGLHHVASGSNSPHGSFKLRFNTIAYAALTDNGKLPPNTALPEGSMVIKDVQHNGQVSLYAFMYKYSGSWIWGEARPNGEVLYSVNKNPGVCTDCHRQPGNRDLVVSFAYY